MTSFFFKVAAALAVLFAGLTAHAQQLTLKPLLHSIGYRVQLPPGYDADSTAFTVVRYRAVGQDWEPGFPASRLSLSEFRGGLFELDPGTSYELEATVIDSFPTLKRDVLTATTTTLAMPSIQLVGTNLRWVSPNGSGNIYSPTQPGNLQTLLAGGLACGTTVLLKGGVYTLGDLTLNLTEDCPESAPITLMAAPGETPVFDGGSYTQYTWYEGTGDTTIWWTNLPAHLEFNAMCIVDGERLYPYAFLTPSPLDPTYPSLWTLGYGLSGFYRNRFNRVFIKMLDGRNINRSQVIFSQKFTCLTVYGNHKNVRLRIKGIHFKYYGKGRCDKDALGFPTTCYPSNTLRFENTSGVVVDSCVFDFCNFPVLFEGNCNDNIVMNCRITDGTGYWSHAAFKRTVDALNILMDSDQGTKGRYLENTGIYFSPNTEQTVTGNIVWNNTVQGVVNGIGLGFFNNSIVQESDISHNRISWCFDGIGALGEHRNVRIWRNDVSYCPVGVSLIGSEQKPAYIFRNVFHHLDQRQNYQNDPSFMTCDGVQTQQSWSTALKLNAGGETKANDAIYFIHNTVHGIEPYAFNLYLWTPTWKTLQLCNNIFYAEGDANFFFDQVKSQPLYHFDSKNDNIVSPVRGVLGIVRPQGGAGCFKYSTAATLRNGLTGVTGSPRIRIEDALNEWPQFADTSKSDFRLQPSSPLIDRGKRVPGFNNRFLGSAPDVGAWEHGVVSTLPLLPADAALTIFPNPTSGLCFVRFHSPGGAVMLQVWNAQGQRVAQQRFDDVPGGSQTIQVETTAWPAGVYFLQMQTSRGAESGRLLRRE
ncbi:MAG: T9SS type A sorting domain-containing protein [Saprospiraceae bacterium]|nr:T9SS type A sorting domain-containing protein [Saprospiraceae bacterium]MDW8229854.1 T9SS type A sorting domain-containing protein [Saprospiraceae bacterium]